MTYLDELSEPEPPIAGDETLTLLGALERERATFRWKCDGLDEAGYRATVGASTLTLGSLLKHLALVEDDYFSHRMLGRALGPPWDGVDWQADPDWEWRTAADDPPRELLALWEAAVARSRAVTEEILAGGGFDTLAAYETGDGQVPNIRRFVVDLVEEYSRHLGHADLIRESIDGVVGEGAPAGTTFAGRG
jgi:uncharacterized protein DUF664